MKILGVSELACIYGGNVAPEPLLLTGTENGEGGMGGLPAGGGGNNPPPGD